MNSVLATGRNLPPGLWLPTELESTEQYLRTNFAEQVRSPEAVIDYGSFVVSLAYYTAPETGRVSMMPRTDDFEAMLDEGYGLTLKALGYHHEGGLSWLQETLGFYPRGSSPDTAALVARYKWIARHAYMVENTRTDLDALTLEGFLDWGAERHLAPGYNQALAILGNERIALRRELGLERKATELALPTQELYRFGARVLAENGQTLGHDELNRKYTGTFPSSPYETVRGRFGTLTQFWLEFGEVPNASGMTREDIRDLGTRYMIKHGEVSFTASAVAELSRSGKFVSKLPITRHFGGLVAYREEVAKAYAQFTELKGKLLHKGVSADVIHLACADFIPTKEYIDEILANETTLQKLSLPQAYYIQRIIQHGFNLEDRVIFDTQLRDVIKLCKKIGLTYDEFSFVFSIIPRFDPAEGLRLVQ